MDNGDNIPLPREIEIQNDTRDQIRNAFFHSVLRLPVNDQQMTPTEIIARKEEYIRYVNMLIRETSDG